MGAVEMAKILFSLMGAKKTKETDMPPDVLPAIDVVPGSSEWETICRQCGECCFERVYEEDDTLVASVMCEFLDPVTRRCTVYERRFEVCHDCIKLTEKNLPSFDWLPGTCGYVVRFGIRKQEKSGT